VKRKSAIAPSELQVPIGKKVIELLDVAYRARRPALLEGATGIGKSQIVAQFARSSGLRVVVLDLSLLEPPDLVGLPVIENGRTSYASPAELPTSGRGVLMLEELNRAEIPVMQPALQLLSARRLHGYELPADWSCVAAINPEDGDYHVTRLDPALRTRFMQISVGAERQSWLAWAARANVHPVVTRVIGSHEDAFDDASPRSWAYASEILHAMRPDELSDRDLVRAALRGYLPTSWAALVGQGLTDAPAAPALDPNAIFGADGAALLERHVRDLAKRTDAVAMLASKLRNHLVSPDLRTRIASGEITLDSLERLFAPLPGDLREQCLEAAAESPACVALLTSQGRAPKDIVRSYVGSAVQADVTKWREALAAHRVRLVVFGVLRWLDEEHVESRTAEAMAPQLRALADDAGPLGADLARWLAVRDLGGA
jgi:hypothetical protein